MDVDEAGRDDLAGGVDLLPRLGDVADGDDPAVADPDVGRAALRAGAVDDEAVADRDVDAHRPPLSAAGRCHVHRSFLDDDAVPLPRRLRRHLPVEHVREHGLRVALERSAEAAAAGRDVREAVSLLAA